MPGCTTRPTRRWRRRPGSLGRSRTSRTRPARRRAIDRPATTTGAASGRVRQATTKPGRRKAERPMRRHNAIEVLTGILVLIVAVGFLGYAVAHSGTRRPAGATALCELRQHRRAERRRRRASCRGQGRQRAGRGDRPEDLSGARDARHSRRRSTAQGQRRLGCERKPAGRHLPRHLAGRRRADAEAGGRLHGDPGSGQPAGSARQVHLQRDQHGERDGREPRQPGAGRAGPPPRGRSGTRRGSGGASR